MSAYRITCQECGEAVHGWNKREAKEAFHRHVVAEHPDKH